MRNINESEGDISRFNSGKAASVTADKGDETFPEVNEHGDIIGQITRKEAHCGTKRLHPVVHLHVLNGDGALYLQQRADWKEVQPGKWDTAVGGHIDWNETVREALAREVCEEIGLTPADYTPQLVAQYVYESAIERELVCVFSATIAPETVPQPSQTETKGGRFWTAEELRDNLGRGVFTPMFEQEYRKYGKMLNNHNYLLIP